MDHRFRLTMLSSEWFNLKNIDWGEKKKGTSKRCREIEHEVSCITGEDPVTVIWGTHVGNAVNISLTTRGLYG